MLAGVINGESSSQLPRARTSQRHKHTANVMAGEEKGRRRGGEGEEKQGAILQREVEESALSRSLLPLVGRSASSGVSVCILPAAIHRMRHVVRQTHQTRQASCARLGCRRA